MYRKLTILSMLMIALMSWPTNGGKCVCAQLNSVKDDSLGNAVQKEDSQMMSDSLSVLGENQLSELRAASEPCKYQLFQNYPNPFNPTTEIALFIEHPARVTLAIYNLLGQRVKVLIDTDVAAGVHTIRWDGMDDFGRLVPAGIYFCRMELEHWAMTRKMMFIE